MLTDHVDRKQSPMICMPKYDNRKVNCQMKVERRLPAEF